MRRRSITALLSLALGVSACAYYDEYGHGGYPAAYGDYRYDGDSYGPGRRADTGFGGRGGPILDPWLVHTDEGRDVVLLGFDENGNGRISEETAHRANVWFRRYADTDRDKRLTDEEIRIGLAQAAQRGRGGGL